MPNIVTGAIINEFNQQPIQIPNGYNYIDETFKPVKCTESAIQSRQAVNGYVYFTTDTKKIYYGVDNKYVPMGGNSGIYYGSRQFSKDEISNGEFIFDFDNSEIEGDLLPNTNDIILNIGLFPDETGNEVADGHFYRVNFTVDNLVYTERLPIAGGGGGSGVIGPGASGAFTPQIQIDKSTRYFRMSDTSMPIVFNGLLNDASKDDIIEKIVYTLNGEELEPDETGYAFGEPITFDLITVKNKLRTESSNSLGIVIYNSYGYSSYKSLKVTFYVIDIALTSNTASIRELKKGQDASFSVVPFGGTSGTTSRYLEYKIWANNNSSISMEFTKEVITLNESTSITIPMSTWDNAQHGVYTVSVNYCVTVPNDVNPKKTETIFYQVIYGDTEQALTPLIAASLNKNQVSQYDTLIIPYMVVDYGADSEKAKVTLRINNETDEANIVLGSINEWKIVFPTLGEYNLYITYNTHYTLDLGKIIVKKYEGDIPVVDTSDTELELYLTSLGRNNTSVNKDVWQWTSNISTTINKNISCNFENFLWGTTNGWVEDEEGNIALKLTNGAKMTIPNYAPFVEDVTNPNETIFKIGQGLTIELDFKFTGILDYNQPLIHCLSRLESNNSIVAGFNITGQKATFNTSDHKTTEIDFNEDSTITEDIKMALQSLTQYFGDNERIHLTYVIEPRKDDFAYILTYLNGVLSGIALLDGATVKDAVGRPGIMTFDSTYGDIYLYNVRVYRRAVSSRFVINNFIADTNNMDEKVNLYQSNNIFTADGLIDRKLIESAGITYVLFKGGCKIPKKENICRYTEQEIKANNFYNLPNTKEDFRLMSVTMYPGDGKNIPSFDVPIELVNDLDNSIVVNDFKDLQADTTYNISRGVRVYGQGTSSMVYPVKNLRLKFIQEQDYPDFIYANQEPVEIVCFKADYMDSSSSHNTQTANLVYDLYSKLNLKTPPQQFVVDNSKSGKIDTYDILTAIRGFPIVCFFENVDSVTGKPNGTYTYIGRYNFNIDKATPEPFGFVPKYYHVDNSFVVDDEGRQRQEVKSVGLLTETINGKTVLPLDEDGKEIVKDVVQCWEILNNDESSPSKFLKPAGVNTTFEQYLKSLTDKGIPEWTKYYEDRYPDDFAGAYKDKKQEDIDEIEQSGDLNTLYRMSAWLNSTATESHEITNKIFDEAIYYRTRDLSYNSQKQYYIAQNQLADITFTLSATLEGIAENADEKIKWSYSFEESTLINKIKEENNIEDNKDLDGKEYVYYYNANNLSWADLQNNEIHLDDYGIFIVSGTPGHGDAIKVTLTLLNNWSTDLLERYTIDNKEYRLAKFYNEFTEYFDMEFTTFYYVITMLLLMMDNRAKNMMLATWDAKIWYPIFYDMDSMLGLNNTGYNKFSYDTEDDPEDKVFNGYDSVLWNNFRECFFNEICSMYARLRNSNLNLDYLLGFYNDASADKWNEALTTADAEYKYIRPYENGYFDGFENTWMTAKEGKFLYAGQGRRSSHRRWWLNNRLKYLDSKYLPYSYGDAKPSTANTFSFRAYALPSQQNSDRAQACIAQVPVNHKFDITSLISSYQSLFVGTTVYGPIYTPANETVTLGGGVRHEVESWILNPYLIMDLGDLSDKYLGDFRLPSGQINLTKLKLGRSAYSNDYDKNGNPEKYSEYYNSLLNSLVLSNKCPYLTELNIARCTGLIQLDISQCNRLTKLYADGCTGLASIKFPQDSILQEIYLPENMSGNFELMGQQHLKTIHFDNNGAKNLLTIKLRDIPQADTYSIAKDFFKNKDKKEYYFGNINWTISEAGNQLIDFSDEDYPSIKKQLKSIDILDTIITYGSPFSEFSTHGNSLTGEITINIDSNEQIYVDEFSIYQKYNKTFPNLKIKYGSNMMVLKAPRLTFMQLDYGAQDNSVFYEVLTSSTGKDLQNNIIYTKNLLSIDGPTGKQLGTPKKNQTVKNSYSFSGVWIGYHPNGESVEYTVDESIENHVYLYSDELVLSESIVFYPVYNVEPRMYKVILKDNEEIVYEWEVPYGTVNNDKEHPEFFIPEYFYRPDEESFTIEQRYNFDGWTTGSEILDIDKLVVTNDITAYSTYSIVNCREVPTNHKCFNIIKQNESSVIITIKEEYKKLLKGKITLPKQDLNDTYINIVGTEFLMGDPIENITHVFFEDNSIYHTIQQKAFYSGGYGQESKPALTYVELPSTITLIDAHSFAYNSQLVTVILPEGLKTINQGAFQYCKNLTNLAFPLNSGETKLPKLLEALGAYAFDTTNINISSIPIGVETLSTCCFTNCPNLNITSLGGDGEGESALKYIYMRVFKDSGKNVNNLILRNSLMQIHGSAFEGYGFITSLEISNKLYSFGNGVPENDETIEGDGYDYLVSIGIDVTNLNSLVVI